MNKRIDRYSGAQRQRGVAIITAILLIAMGTITMVAISSRQQLDMHRERNEGLIQQARAFGVSGERFAAALLTATIRQAFGKTQILSMMTGRRLFRRYPSTTLPSKAALWICKAALI